jgi:hypothetical protein
MTGKRNRSRRVNADLKAIEALAAEVRARKAAMTVVPVPARKPEPPPSPPVPAFDPGPPPITTLFGMGRPKVPPPSRKDGKRRSGDYLLAGQRIKAAVAAKPWDNYNGPDIECAEGWMNTALQPLPDDMAQVGSGGELIPVGDEGGALVLRNTVEHPHYVTADASRDRLDLASKAGVLELALDAVETVQAANSAAGLVTSIANPGGRLTGFHFMTNDLTAKRAAPTICRSRFPGSP